MRELPLWPWLLRHSGVSIQAGRGAGPEPAEDWTGVSLSTRVMHMAEILSCSRRGDTGQANASEEQGANSTAIEGFIAGAPGGKPHPTCLVLVLHPRTPLTQK